LQLTILAFTVRFDYSDDLNLVIYSIDTLMSEINSQSTALHNLNPLNRFSDRAADYVNYRPSYPAAAIDMILDELGAAPIVADIGAGTGISARLLADRGARVIAIEPNAAMRTAAVAHPGVEFREGTAEVTGIEDTSIDLITCFQAFHWFDPEPTLLEFRRILKSTATAGNPVRLALVWNNRDKQDAFTNEYSDLIIAASTDRVIHQRSDSAQPLLVSPHFTNIQSITFANSQALDLPGLIGRVRSNSYIPRDGIVLQQLISALEKLHDRFQDDRGFVDLKYSTSVHLAEPSSPQSIS
jgi:SAM-dependent methyltransferase